MKKNTDLQGLLVIAAVIAAAALVLLRNLPSENPTNPAPNGVVPVSNPDQIVPTTGGEFILGNLQPVTPIPSAVQEQPTITPTEAIAMVSMIGTPTPTRLAPNDPTRPAPTAAATPIPPDVRYYNRPGRDQLAPPPELAPLSSNPMDHFYFERPVDSSSNSQEIFWYVYGSNGANNDYRVHHGIDLPNPIGEPVYAAGDGVVIWSGSEYMWRRENGTYDRAYTYGNVVVIEHSFGWQGKRLYTLYAHLQHAFPQVGDVVQRRDIIGLSGNTGQVSGPHVHFEVRVGENDYWATRNPILWMVPYLNHGVIAGRILGADGRPIEDATIEIRRGDQVIDTSTTYVRPCMPGDRPRTCHVNQDDYWKENFVIGDVPVGNYDVIVRIGNFTVRKPVTVVAATTTFIDFGQVFP
jgi:murein DD-endopeptidase MepM/ murein hydrolase activator NlpD